ncbi:reverse transcriptase domain-containing protein [Tanacetum coccineum]|uniref:Reverse transcriptase domain-containing protein n=1 Tax=Tanacetum coccineum TaxID=301880 RepID=A0ABQ4YZT8_9ASTR
MLSATPSLIDSNNGDAMQQEAIRMRHKQQQLTVAETGDGAVDGDGIFVAIRQETEALQGLLDSSIQLSEVLLALVEIQEKERSLISLKDEFFPRSLHRKDHDRHPNLLELEESKDIIDSQLEGEGAQRVELEGTGTGSREGPFEPAQLAQTTPSPAFIKENIDVLRTMIKEHDQQTKAKATLKKLVYDDSGEEGSDSSETKGLLELFSSESFGTSGTSGTQDRNKSKSKTKTSEGRTKCRGRMSEHKGINSDSGCGEDSKDTCKDLSTPYKRPKPTPFTTRITRFIYHRRAKLSRNLKVYEGSKDQKDHLGIFSAATEQEEWPMPIWCKMFHQTLSGAARNLFDDLEPKSVDNFEELSHKFLEELSQQKRYAKDPTEIHGIKRRLNEGLQAFMDRFKSKNSHIKGVPPMLHISSFMYGHGHPELANTLNDKISKTVDEIFERVRAFIRGKVAEIIRGRNGPREFRRNMGTCVPYSRRDTFKPLTKTLKEILEMESVNFPPPPPLIGTPEKQNLNKFSDFYGDKGHNTNDCYHLKKQIEEVVASGKLAHLVKDIRQGNQRNRGQGRGNVKVINMVGLGGNRKRPQEMEGPRLIEEIAFSVIPHNSLTYDPIILEGTIESFRSRLKKSNASLVGFSGKIYHPLGLIDLKVTMGEPTKNKTVLLEFAIVKCRSPYNGNLKGVQTDRGNAEFIEGSTMASAHGADVKGKRACHIEEPEHPWSEAQKGAYGLRRFLGRRDSKIKVGLKNFEATLQRVMDKVLAEQKGRNVEVYLEEVVMKSKSEQSLIEDVEEILHKFQRVNMKIDPSECTFGMEKGKFLGYVATIEGIKSDPEKVKGLEICYTAKEKALLALIHTTRCLTNIFRTYKVSVVTDSPKEDILKVLETTRQQALWAAELRTYHVSYIRRKEAKGKIVKKFFGKGEQVLQVPGKNNEGASIAREKPQDELTPTPRALRLYVGRESNKEGSRVGMVMVDPEEKEYSHAICLNFYAFEDDIDYEALLAGLVALPEERYREEIMDATTPFHMFRITYLPKSLNPKAKALTGLTSIRLEFLGEVNLRGLLELDKSDLSGNKDRVQLGSSRA